MRLRPLLCALALLVPPARAFAAFERPPGDPRFAALGGAGVALQGSPWAVLVNPAALAPLEHRVLAAAYTPSTFGLAELSRAGAAYAEPFGGFSLGASAATFGFELYRETEIALAGGIDVTETVSAGAALRACFLAVEGYGQDFSVAVDVGVLVRFAESLTWGVAIGNVNGARITAEREPLPRVFVTGVAYRPVPDLTLTLDLAKDPEHPLEVRGGAGFRILNALELRAGTATEPSAFTAGAGVEWDLLRFDYAFESHPDLGPTHRIGLTVAFGGR